ncbi:MAG: preprotein translocase subunit YajC, partial [Planctomycetota bacterium]
MTTMDLASILLPLAQEAATEVAPAAVEGASEGGAKEPAPQTFQLLRTFVPFILIGIFFYLILIAPQRKKQKETQKMIAAVAKGDKVTTIGGILGTVVGVADDHVTVKVDETSNTKLKFQKQALASVEPKNAPEK